MHLLGLNKPRNERFGRPLQKIIRGPLLDDATGPHQDNLITKKGRFVNIVGYDHDGFSQRPNRFVGRKSQSRASTDAPSGSGARWRVLK